MSLLVLKLYSKYIELVNIKCYTKYVLKILRKGDFVMNKLLKNSAGIAAIVIVLIVIVGVVAGGATVLAVRMIVTGEDYLAPFEELGWISSDEEDENTEKDDKVKDVVEDEVKEVTTLADPSRLSEESLEPETVQYYGYVTSAEMGGFSPTDEYYDLYDSIKLEINLFALDNKAVEIVFHIDISDALKVMYEEYGDELTADGYEYDSYQDFEDEWLPYFESMMESMLSYNEEMEQYVDMYIEDGVIEMYVTEEGFDSLYDTYNIDPESENIQDFIDAVEEGLGVTLEEV